MTEEVNARFGIEIPDFNLRRRQVLIDRLCHDEQMRTAIVQACAEGGLSRQEAQARVDADAREIVPSFNAYA